MDVASFVLLSHEQALRRQLDITANNMANANTIGFKREQALFHEYIEEAENAQIEDARKTSFVLDYGAIHDTRQGAFQATSNPLDVMIEGPGYLTVEGPNDTRLYTRQGLLKITENGDLVTSTGRRLLNDNGQPITLPAGQRTGVTITHNGTLVAGDAVLGRLTVTQFENEHLLNVQGDGFLAGENGRVLTAAETRIQSGGLEGSNVETITETTNMVQIMRSYQTSQRMVEDLADMRKQTINRIGRVDR